MQALAPRLSTGPRAGPLAAVAAIHVALVAGLLLVPAVRERLALAAPIFVELREAARERPPEPRPLPRPALREPPSVNIPLPPIALAPEIPVVAPHDRGPTLSGPVFTPSAPPGPPAPIEPPRFDMAYLNNPAPAYPGVSRRMKEQGRVILRVLVSAAGEAQNVEVRTSSGSQRLDRAAVDAVRRWRFAPARRGAESISAWALVPILFELDA